MEDVDTIIKILDKAQDEKMAKAVQQDRKRALRIQTGRLYRFWVRNR